MRALAHVSSSSSSSSKSAPSLGPRFPMSSEEEKSLREEAKRLGFRYRVTRSYSVFAVNGRAQRVNDAIAIQCQSDRITDSICPCMAYSFLRILLLQRLLTLLPLLFKFNSATWYVQLYVDITIFFRWLLIFSDIVSADEHNCMRNMPESSQIHVCEFCE